MNRNNISVHSVNGFEFSGVVYTPDEVDIEGSFSVHWDGSIPLITVDVVYAGDKKLSEADIDYGLLEDLILAKDSDYNRDIL